jgi:hypothetical protein
VNVKLDTVLTRPPGTVQSAAVTVSTGAEVTAVPGVPGFAVAVVVKVACVHSIVTWIPNGSNVSVRSVPAASPVSRRSPADTLDPLTWPVVSTSLWPVVNATAVAATAVIATAAAASTRTGGLRISGRILSGYTSELVFLLIYEDQGDLGRY